MGAGHTLPSISEDNEAEEQADEVEEPPLSPQSPNLRRNGNSRLFRYETAAETATAGSSGTHGSRNSNRYARQ